jgi:Tol biopolymer transport system component
MRLAAVLLVALAVLAPASAAPPDDGILFERSFDLWVIASDGTGERRLTRGQQSSMPRWSPDHALVAFASTRVATQEIWTMAPDGSRARRVTFSSPGQGFLPAWSPDGSALAYARAPKGLFGDDRPPRNPVSGIWVAEVDRSGQEALTTGLTDNMPDWSATGLVAFVRQTRRSTELFVVPEAGGKPRRLLAPPADPRWAGDQEPDWSPDGRRIAFSRATVPLRGPEYRRTIVVANADGSGLRRLTRRGDCASPRWSPDGTRIAFVRDGNLWVMNADGTGQRRLSRDPRGEAWIDW